MSTVAGTWSKAAARLRRDALPGAVAGLAGGAVFGAAMGRVGTLPNVAQIVRSDSPVTGFVLHMVIAAVIGAGFGLLVTRQHVRSSEVLFWGLIYGAFWWFLGPQTLLPILTGRPPAWDLAGAQYLVPSLVGHLVYGGVTAAVFALLRRGSMAPRPRTGLLLRGVVAGAIVTAALSSVVSGATATHVGRLAVVGVLAGAGYPLLFGTDREYAGPALARGSVYGFVVWVLAELTVAPLLGGGELGWSRQAAAAAVPLLPPTVLLGAGIAVVFGWLGGLTRGLFLDDVRMFHREAPGGRGLRAMAYGALAGLAGGALYTVVLVAVNGLPQIAQIMGSRAPATGLVVHLVVAQIIGVSYAVAFRRSSFDIASGMGWGVCYGFFWWVLGTLTLLPVLTGAPVRWDPAAIAAGYPALVGHLAYGAALGATHYLLEARANPWWVSRNEVEARRVVAQRSLTLGSAPAVWGLTVLVAVTVPLLVGT